MDEATTHIVTYYETRYEEATRLERRPQSRLERIRTLELLREVLPAAPARILDVGGGPGAYARELLADGHHVRLVDLVPAHVDQARAGHPPIDAVVGDARSLPEPDRSQDATLLLGPLYHLHDRADRIRAIREAIRVTRPGGPIAVAAISRFAGPLDFTATARFDDRTLAEARRLLTDGVNDTSIGFTHAYFHRIAELTAECQEAGLTDVVVHGVEGPGWPAAEAAQHGPHAESVFQGALHLARLYSTEPELVAVSSHLLALGSCPHQ
ncbi:type 11 methyltransferase [Actinoplanes sp. SE50]|uniref:class I SAM-dependent methyltransferase n=1 Tax=unclassified Actinoplanes TaxID=2626549 RepID=UPI00023ECEF8|nr:MULTISPECIES: class I SAM-dependent methyltransferase [unclassified Actinoplanes]AEV86060.1 Ubiquinone/menaquinone biosynthesis methyltransferase ubiE [Actinoplanes sp. SE50/110]ATO84458.1 type 11 methyltransferase [Actinoplanes sp. SE50]SLM01868.1 type 11 methyltransferase [Actinoplanes sp. SE50/110]